MNLFLDTSSLVKLYHRESGTKELELLFSNQTVDLILLTEFAGVEFYSAIWKKLRMLEITHQKAQNTINLFEQDFTKYFFVPINTGILNHSKNLIIKYGIQGLRTLDAIQLSTAVLLKNKVDLFQTSDKLLQNFFEAEGLPITIKA